MSEDLVKRLWSSDAASALTNEAARLIEGLQAELRATYLEALAVNDTNTELASHLSSSQAHLSEAVKVLEPFAAKADTYNEVPGIIRFNDDIELWQLEDNAGMRVDLTVGQLRAARQFIATLGEENEGT